MSEVEVWFDEFWSKYPRRVGKLEAKKSFVKALKMGAKFGEIMRGVDGYIGDIQARETEARYVKHPSTWLNQGCWDDEYELNVPVKHEVSPELSRWQARVNAWKKTGAWMVDMWGAPPDSPNTKCPAELMEAV